VVFTSIVFLCMFLPAVLLAYHAVPERFRNAVALTGSLFFYAWGAPTFVVVLVVSSLLDYVASRRLPAWRGTTAGRALLSLAVAANLAVFLYCKYMNFFVEQANHLLGWLHHEPIAWTAIVLPIGISFFTFQKLSYLVDVYRGTAEPAPGFGHYLLYVTLFPQLIAGPIVRYHDVSAQLISRSVDDEAFLGGAWRFATGLAKKVLIADTLATTVDLAFGASAAAAVDPATLTRGAAWLAAFCYSMQLYFDFSGYSDMAIGLGRMLGFRFLENFDHPYVSRSMNEFWQRWHISLTNWMREYLYIPLGGNRLSPWRTTLNLWIVFLVSGFWHGASWNFIAWGALHGALLTSERFARHQRWPSWPAALAMPRTFLAVLVGWVLFRAWDLTQAVGFLRAMLLPADSASLGVADIARPWTWWTLGAASLLAVAPLWARSSPWLGDWVVPAGIPHETRRVLLRAGCCTALVVASFALIVSSDFNPFIYFQF
jgi:alginate O-acetyltransferase complex protein AlgI